MSRIMKNRFLKHCGSLLGRINREYYKINYNRLIYLSISLISIYLFSIYILSLLQGEAFNSVIVFDAVSNYSTFSTFILQPIILASSFALIFLLPGLIWTLKFYKTNFPLNLFCIAFVTNLVILITITTLFKLFTNFSLNRTNFLILIIITVVTGLVLLRKENFSIDFSKHDVKKISAIILLIILLMLFFNGKILIENFTGDGTECYEYSRSLETNLLPYWDLENGYWGFHQYYVLFSYPNSFSLLMLGESEAAVRLPYFVYIFIICLILISFLDIKEKKERIYQYMLLPGIVFFTIFNFYYSTYIAFADIAHPTGTNTFFTLLILLSIYFLFKNNFYMAAITSFLSMLSLPSGRLAFLIIFVLFYVFFKEKRRKTIESGVFTLMLFILYNIFLSVYNIFKPFGETQYSYSNILRMFFNPENLFSNLSHNIFIFIIVTGIVPIFALLFFKHDKISRYLSLITLGYVFTILISSNFHYHYYIPVMLLPLVISVRLVLRERRVIKLTYSVLLLFVFIGLMFYIFPEKNAINTDHRDFSSHTCMVFDSYKEAVENSFLIDEIVDRNFSREELFWIGRHSWVHYADLVDCIECCPKDNYSFYLTQDEFSDSNYTLLSSNGRAYLYINNDVNLSEIRNKTMNIPNKTDFNFEFLGFDENSSLILILFSVFISRIFYFFVAKK